MPAKDTSTIGGHTKDKLLKIAQDVVERKTKDSEVMSVEPLAAFPKFQLSELTLGRVLGRGGFCVVSEINQIKLAAVETTEKDTSQHSETEKDETKILNIVQNRSFMEKYYIRDGKDCRYAIKILQKTEDPQTYTNGVVDLVVEAKVLANIRHPNIIKMRALSAGDFYDGQFFLVLDKLYDVLSNRLLTWKKKKGGLIPRLMDRGGKKAREFLSERVVICYDLACALKFLHENKLIYRDLKPDNIGFDVRGDVKIFDFGLAKEFDKAKADADGTYKFTGDTGSPRYMAPEVGLDQTYNENVDSYSFCVLTWQILKLETPYDTFNMRMLKNNVFEKGARPKPDPKWSSNLCNILANGWLHNKKKRWDMEKICEGLQQELDDLNDEDYSGRNLADVSQKSMHSLRKLGM